MAARAKIRAEEPKKRPARPRRPRLEYVIEDTSTGPEDLDAAAATIAAWLDRTPPR